MSCPRGVQLCALVLACGACTGSAGEHVVARASPMRTPELVVATDLDPDPGVVEVHLAATLASVELVPGHETEVLAYRDAGDPDARASVPGPLIDARVGDRIVIHLDNELPLEHTTLHIHGARLPAEMDGNPAVSGTVAPGERATTAFEARDAGLFWYHPHVNTAVQLDRGLQGALIVRRSAPPPVDRERILMLDDVELDADHQLVVEASQLDLLRGRTGPQLLINGRPPARIEAAAGARERWRIVNSSNGRYFELGLEPGVGFDVIGGDGGALPEPHRVTRLRVAPGERYDLLVALDGEPGEQKTLVTREVDTGRGAPFAEAVLATVVLTADRLLAKPSQASAFAREMPPLLPSSGAPLRLLEMSGDLDGPNGPIMYINRQQWPFNERVEVELDSVEIWELRNESAGAHPFHLHGTFFQLLDDAGRVDRRAGWKDTVDLPGGGVVRLAVRHDAAGRWLYHCQIPEHAGRGMMGDLIVRSRQ